MCVVKISYSTAADVYTVQIVQKIRKIEKKFGCSFVYASNTSVGIDMCGYFRLVLHFSIVFLYQKFQQGFFFIFLTLNAEIY